MGRWIKGIETKYYEERESFFKGLKHLSAFDRRGFMKIAGLSAGIAAAKSLVSPQSFQLVEMAQASSLETGFRFAYISDSHLYTTNVDDRFVRSMVKAVDDVNALDPQPDFVLFGGDLAQLGRKDELALGAQILKSIKAPVKMVVGEHDWFFDMGDQWQSLFGAPHYSFDHKGVHFVTLMSVQQKDFWTERKLSPAERMQAVAALDNGTQSRFEVGQKGRAWLQADLAKVDKTTPVVVFSHSPLYHYYRDWNFWTEDADPVQAMLSKFDNVTVIHGHTHQMLLNKIGNINFYGLLSTAWPWPHAPEGLPKLTVQLNGQDPFMGFDECGNGHFDVLAACTAEKLYNLWNRNPVSVRSTYFSSYGKKDQPAAATLAVS